MAKRQEKKISFGEQKAARDKKKKINDCSWFGLILGVIFFFVFGLRALCSVGAAAIIFKILTGLGVVIFLIGGFFPIILDKPMRLLQKIANVIGKYLLRILMIPVYVILLIPAVFLGRSTKKKYEFAVWSGDAAGDKPEFLPYKEPNLKSSSMNVLGTLNNLFYFLAKNKLLFLVPVVVILVIIGLVFFFISANSVFTFIYALF